MNAAQQKITVTVGDISINMPAKTILKNVLAELTGNALPANTAPTTGIPAIGKEWPDQGGVFAGIMRGENGQPDYYLIVHAIIGNNPKLEFGGAGQETVNANHEFDGLANTKALADGNHPAADWAASLNVNGFNDYYLPARRELALCYANVPDLFEKEWHWSSTQHSAGHAYLQNFSDGYQSNDHKGDDCRVRAVRRLLIIQ